MGPLGPNAASPKSESMASGEGQLKNLLIRCTFDGVDQDQSCIIPPEDCNGGVSGIALPGEVNTHNHHFAAILLSRGPKALACRFCPRKSANKRKSVPFFGSFSLNFKWLTLSAPKTRRKNGCARITREVRTGLSLIQERCLPSSGPTRDKPSPSLTILSVSFILLVE